MSRQNLQLVRRVLGEAQHNPSALWEVLDGRSSGNRGDLDVPDAGPAQWHEPAGVQEFFRRWIGPFRDGKLVRGAHCAGRAEALEDR